MDVDGAERVPHDVVRRMLSHDDVRAADPQVICLRHLPLLDELLAVVLGHPTDKPLRYAGKSSVKIRHLFNGSSFLFTSRARAVGQRFDTLLRQFELGRIYGNLRRGLVVHLIVFFDFLVLRRPCHDLDGQSSRRAGGLFVYC